MFTINSMGQGSDVDSFVNIWKYRMYLKDTIRVCLLYNVSVDFKIMVLNKNWNYTSDTQSHWLLILRLHKCLSKGLTLNWTFQYVSLGFAGKRECQYVWPYFVIYWIWWGSRWTSGMLSGSGWSGDQSFCKLM